MWGFGEIRPPHMLVTGEFQVDFSWVFRCCLQFACNCAKGQKPWMTAVQRA